MKTYLIDYAVRLDGAIKTHVLGGGDNWEACHEDALATLKKRGAKYEDAVLEESARRERDVATLDNLHTRLEPGRPLAVAYGMGVDSTAAICILAQLYRAGETWARPDVIQFANTGGERKETYDYLDVFNDYLRSQGFPEVTVVKYRPVRATYDTLEDNCLQNKTLPSLAFGRKACSLKYKAEPQNKWMRSFGPAKAAWAAGEYVIKLIGYDCSPKDSRRSKVKDDLQYHYWYPLRELGLDRKDCEGIITSEGLPLPIKSSCFFCPAVKAWELDWYSISHPEYLERIVRIEANAEENLGTVKGLWRTKSMTDYIIENELLPLPVVDAIRDEYVGRAKAA